MINLAGLPAASAIRGLGEGVVSSGFRLAAFARSFLTRGERGGAVVELALLMPFLVAILFGILDFGQLYVNQQLLVNAVASATRYAALNSVSTAFSNSATPAFNTIQGQVRLATAPNGTVLIPNDDAHIRISYGTFVSNVWTECDHYVQASNSFTPAPLATCGVAGNLVQIVVTYSYVLSTPIAGAYPGGTIPLHIQSTMIVSQ